MTTNFKGDLAIAKVILTATQKGYTISKPLSDSARYDLILDINGILKRVQVKYADGKCSQATGVIRVGLEKVYKGKKLFYSDQDIDLLLVYLPKIDKICSFYAKDYSEKRNLFIRYIPAKNGQSKGCLLAESYFWD